MDDLGFYSGKRVFLTGHTGFKGAWMCHILANAGAVLTGYALEPPTDPSLFSLCGAGKNMTSVIGDIRDQESLARAFEQAKPEMVIHMAAQPIVSDSYKNPAYTYETNVMGTVHILECVRNSDTAKSFLNVTTDKVYLNREWEWGYRETDPLDGFDPYSNSKSCSELVTHSYKNSFLTGGRCAVSTARAGNVIGGGDFAHNRIIPDCVRAAEKGERIYVRNPHSTRPYQHVLEPLFAYLLIAKAQYEDKKYADWYNVGPDDGGCVTTGQMADLFCEFFENGMTWESGSNPNDFHEANFLKLDCSHIKTVLGWKPRWTVREAVEKTVEWTKAYLQNGDVLSVMNQQIKEYLNQR